MSTVFNTTNTHEQGEVINIGHDQLNTRDIIINNHVYHIYDLTTLPDPLDLRASHCVEGPGEHITLANGPPPPYGAISSLLSSTKKHPDVELEGRTPEDGYIILNKMDFAGDSDSSLAWQDPILYPEILEAPDRALLQVRAGLRLWQIFGL
ncbi:hypothetical protein HWV62_37358 [Athelia sp. TMB]|nr:hypothetical protein HWV62_37358 [Athelia sp. TMB]